MACDVLLACAATRSRSRRSDMDEKYSCRDSAQEMTPQRPTRLGVQDQPTREPSTAHPSRTLEPVGGPRRRWLAEGARNLAPQYCRPGGLANANHRIRHDAHNQGARRLEASDAGNQSPRTSREGYLRKKTGPRVGAHAKGNEKETPNPQASEKHQRQEDNRQKHQRPARRATSATGEFRAWPDIPPTGELERVARGHSETRTQLSILSVLGSVAR